MNGKDAYYFPHDANARNDLKVSAMIAKYGMAGYGQYWIIVEVLRESASFEIEYKQYAFDALAKQMQCTPEQVQCFIDECINLYSLLKSDGEKIWSESLKRRMKIKDEIVEKRRQAAISRWSNASAMQVQCKSNAIKGKESKGNKRKVKNQRGKSASSKACDLKAQGDSDKEKLSCAWKENFEFYRVKYPILDLDFQFANILDWANRKPKQAHESVKGDLNLFFQRWLNREKPQFKPRGVQATIVTNDDLIASAAERKKNRLRELPDKISQQKELLGYYEEAMKGSGLDEPSIRKMKELPEHIKNLEDEFAELQGRG